MAPDQWLRFFVGPRLLSSAAALQDQNLSLLSVAALSQYSVRQSGSLAGRAIGTRDRDSDAARVPGGRRGAGGPRAVAPGRDMAPRALRLEAAPSDSEPRPGAVSSAKSLSVSSCSLARRIMMAGPGPGGGARADSVALASAAG